MTELIVQTISATNPKTEIKMQEYFSLFEISRIFMFNKGGKKMHKNIPDDDPITFNTPANCGRAMASPTVSTTISILPIFWNM